MNQPVRIAIFASGRGSNAENIIRYFHTSDSIKVALVLTNNPDAGVIDVAKSENVPVEIVPRSSYSAGNIQQVLDRYRIDLIVLAGFLWLLPAEVVEKYPKRIINIHPALLPKYGGKGMYGMNVHKAVLESRETETGITIHYVDSGYDTGEIIFQKSCPIDPGSDDPENVANCVHDLEYRYFPGIIEKIAAEISRQNQPQ